MKSRLSLAFALVLSCLSLPMSLAAQDAAPGASALEAYGKGDAAEAARRYRILLDTRGESPDLLFNLGTAWAEAGELGPAVWALEKARVLSPRDKDIQTNLRTVRERIRVNRVETTVGKLTEGEPEGAAWWRLLTSVKPIEFAILVVLFNILGFGCLIARRGMRPGGAKDATTVFAIIFLALFGTALAGQLAQSSVRANMQLAIVLKANQNIYRTPTPNAQHKTHPDVYEGSLIQVLEEREDGWIQVCVIDHTKGWIRAEDLGMLR